jgi:Fic family protein
MPRILPNSPQALLVLIAAFPDGIGLSALQQQLQQQWTTPPSRRTLQRWLDELIAQGQLTSQGATSARVYLPAAPPSSPPAPSAQTVGEINVQLPAPSIQAVGETYVPLSSAGAEVRDYVRLPLIQRAPVGYQPGFLEIYQPNHSAYLPDAIRQHLHQIGRTAAGERPAGTYARDIFNRLLVDLSWASSRLEGNTYTRLDTEQLIRFGQAAAGKDAQETQMILNHKAAIELLIEDAQDIGFNVFTVLNLHAILSDNLLPDPASSGRLRQRQVQISGTVFHPLAVPQQIEDLFRLLLAKAEAIADPFEQAFFIMVQLPYLQPFEDVNKRVSRLAANIPLIRHNLCPLSFLDVPERAYVEGLLGIYERNRIELMRDVFVWAYERSCQQYLATRQTLVDPDPFRLRYRTALIDTVQSLVRTAQPASRADIQRAAAAQVAATDLERFIAMVETDLAHLHEGNIARYRLRPSEYHAWLARQPGQQNPQ